MGATFTTEDEWQGQIKSGYQTADKVAGLAAPSEGYVWRRQRYISDRFRIGQGLTSWSSDAGNRVYGDDLDITNGPDSTAGSAAGEPDYMVNTNDLIPYPPGSGIWKETYVAEGFSEWEEWLLVVT